uniref:Uncharacterized protein n=1 Tax=Solanum tuberosum TaxID=4113 RepID=M1B508_SOLTU
MEGVFASCPVLFLVPQNRTKYWEFGLFWPGLINLQLNYILKILSDALFSSPRFK